METYYLESLKRFINKKLNDQTTPKTEYEYNRGYKEALEEIGKMIDCSLVSIRLDNMED